MKGGGETVPESVIDDATPSPPLWVLLNILIRIGGCFFLESQRRLLAGTGNFDARPPLGPHADFRR